MAEPTASIGPHRNSGSGGTIYANIIGIAHPVCKKERTAARTVGLGVSRPALYIGCRYNLWAKQAVWPSTLQSRPLHHPQATDGQLRGDEIHGLLHPGHPARTQHWQARSALRRGGSSDRGLEEGGCVRTKWAAERNPMAVHTYRANCRGPDDTHISFGSVEEEALARAIDVGTAAAGVAEGMSDGGLLLEDRVVPDLVST
jgi:hypothetical protein